MGFVDEVTLHCCSGRGGDGALTWRREACVPKGGPNGGNGGKGGSIFFRVDPNLRSFEKIVHQPRWKAQNGENGASQHKKGKNGEDLIIFVPQGTLVYESGTLKVDLKEKDASWLACQGGDGGRGNASFATSRRRAPFFRTEGKPGEAYSFVLELRTISDVGIVGRPNAGKSTLFRALTGAQPDIGDYAFTTKTPNCGQIESDDYQRVTIADIPGLVEGSHENRGIGYTFLRHIQRTRFLLYLVDASRCSPREDLDILRKELSIYDENLLEKPPLIVWNKVDQCSEEQLQELPQEVPSIQVSALTGKGIDRLKTDILKRILENED